MKMSFVVFEGMTVLDFVGAYDALTRLKTMRFRNDVEWDICATTSQVSDGKGIVIVPTKVNETLADYDLLVVPGGPAAFSLSKDQDFSRWLATYRFNDRLAASVCSGALILGALGVLKGRRATTHRSCINYLRPSCSEVVEQRIVDEGTIVTAAGVTASIDLGLHLVSRLSDEATAQKIAFQMEYIQNV